MRTLIILFVLFLASCSNNKKETTHNEKTSIDFSPIEDILNRTNTSTNINPTHTQSGYTYFGSQIIEQNKVKESFLYLKGKNTNTLYAELAKWFNKNMGTSNEQPTFNSWHNDSIEYLLYLQPDSTIFVNSYTKKYQ